MSSTYTVVLPDDRWPTYSEVNADLREQGFPLQLVAPANPDERLSETKNTLGILAEMNGQTVELDAAVGVVTQRVIAEINDSLRNMGADFTAHVGDRVLSFGLGRSDAEWNAAGYVLAALVRERGGYGYETQSNSHGRESWAASLLSAVSKEPS